MKVIVKLNDIPKNAEVMLYGAGEGGQNFLNLLKEFRPDIAFKGFLDSHKSGNGITQYHKDFDLDKKLVIITSMYKKEIEKKLIENGVKNYLVVPNRFICKCMCDYLRNNKLIDPAENEIDFSFFNEGLSIEEEQKIAEVTQMLPEPDRSLYKIVTSPKNLRRITEYTYQHRDKEQYFEKIDPKKIHCVIDGGLYDGFDALQFIEKCAPPCKVYGFDPYTEAFQNSPYFEKIKANPNITIIPKGLWSSQKVLTFTFSDQGSSFIAPRNELLPREEKETTTIDAYVEENHIEKIDMIKLDIEGAELEALKGGVKTIQEHRPQMAICIYHSKSDYYEIPLYLKSILRDYDYRLGHYKYAHYDTVLYALPKKIS